MSNKYNIKYHLLLLLITIASYIVAQNTHVDSLINIAETTKNDTVKFHTYMKISKAIDELKFAEKCSYNQKAIAIAEKIKNDKYIGIANRELGDLYKDKGDLGTAMLYFMKALEIDKQIGYKHGEAMDYNFIGDIYHAQNKLDEALGYYKKSLKINRSLDSLKTMSKTYNNIGIIYTKTKKHQDALKCYDSTLLIAKKFNSKNGIAGAYMNKSIVYYQMGNMTDAINYTQKAVDINHEIGKPSRLLSCYSNLGELYLYDKQFEKAELTFFKASEYIPLSADKELIKGLYDNFVLLYKTQSNNQKAYEYYVKSVELKDTIREESNNRIAIEASAKYDSEQNLLEIENLQKEKELSEGLVKRERNFRILIGIFALATIVFLSVLIKRIIQKRKKNKELAFAFQKIEKQKLRIADSINYSKRIQDSILPSKALKNRLFSDSFVLYMPKDIVSGDFYWFAEKNGKKIVACCDCTGHGVPGSLMSMVGNNILNHLVHELEIISADEILNQLHKEIRKALKQDQQHKSMDGMDLALLVFHSETQIDYAGAQRPLWIIQQGTSEIVEIKANKFSIGGYQAEEIRQFTKHTIELKKGDCLYMFTDGYADQFGGKEGRKFMTKRLKELLLTNNYKPITEQETNLRNAIIDWKGNYEQVDDILMIAIRI